MMYSFLQHELSRKFSSRSYSTHKQGFSKDHSKIGSGQYSIEEQGFSMVQSNIGSKIFQWNARHEQDLEQEGLPDFFPGPPPFFPKIRLFLKILGSCCCLSFRAGLNIPKKWCLSLTELRYRIARTQQEILWNRATFTARRSLLFCCYRVWPGSFVLLHLSGRLTADKESYWLAAAPFYLF